VVAARLQPSEPPCWVASVAVGLRSRLEAGPRDTVRKLAGAERETRKDGQRSRLRGRVLAAELDVAHELVDLVLRDERVEHAQLHCLERLTKRDNEVAGQRRRRASVSILPALKIYGGGVIKLTYGLAVLQE